MQAKQSGLCLKCTRTLTLTLSHNKMWEREKRVTVSHNEMWEMEIRVTVSHNKMLEMG